MISLRRSCSNHPDEFCYICGEYTLKEQRISINDFVNKKPDCTYFGMKFGDQDKSWDPDIVCITALHPTLETHTKCDL